MLREFGSTKKVEVSSNLQYIDSLRGVAILMVILVHTSQTVSGLHSYIQTVCNFGQMGVQLFFVLSAFTLCLSMERRSGQSGLGSFYNRRFFRIAPLYYFGIVFYLFFYSTINFFSDDYFFSTDQYTSLNISANLFFFHGFYPPANNNIVPGGWSIGTEMAFYLIFPFLFLLYKRFREYKAALFLIPVTGLLITYSIFLLLSALGIKNINNDSFYYFNLINQLPVFLLGISFYFMPLNFKPKKFLHNIVAFAILIFLLFVAVFVFSRTRDITMKPFISGVAFLSLLFVFRTVKFLNFEWLQNLGRLSYSIYLFHFVFAWVLSSVIVELLKGSLDSNLLLFICFTVSVLLSAFVANLSSPLIEKPGIHLGNKVLLYFKKKPERTIKTIDLK